MTEKERVQIRGKGWRKQTSIDARKFDVIAKAIRQSLTDEPVSFTRLVELVAQRVRSFDGSVSWYTISCARELEVRGELVRQEKPVRYLKPVHTARKRS